MKIKQKHTLYIDGKKIREWQGEKTIEDRKLERSKGIEIKTEYVEEKDYVEGR